MRPLRPLGRAQSRAKSLKKLNWVANKRSNLSPAKEALPDDVWRKRARIEVMSVASRIATKTESGCALARRTLSFQAASRRCLNSITPTGRASRGARLPSPHPLRRAPPLANVAVSRHEWRRGGSCNGGAVLTWSAPHENGTRNCAGRSGRATPTSILTTSTIGYTR